MQSNKSFFQILATFLILALLAIVAFPEANAQESMKKAPDFQIGIKSNYGFDDTVGILKSAIEAENLMVIKEINAQKMLRMVGVQTKGMKQVLFFHPRFMKRIMEINKSATIEPPLKIAVMEMPNGKTMVRYVKPSYIFDRYEGLQEIGQEFDALVEKIVGNISK